MNLSKYTFLRFAIYFVVFAVLLLTCSTLFPGAWIGKWYTIGGIALGLTLVEFFIVGNRPHMCQCLQKQHIEEISTRLNELGYSLTDRKVDEMIFLKKVTPIRFEVAKLILKKNCIELEVPDEDADEFAEWSVTTASRKT